MLYYVFTTKKDAFNAESYISMVGGAPIVGKNAKTGKPAPDKCKTERWAEPIQRLDGKWVFPYVGDDEISKYPTLIKDLFNNTFTYTLEEYDESWFTEEE